MYNFIFTTDYNPWVINNNWIELQLNKSTNSTMKVLAYTNQHQLIWGINPQHIPICQQVRDLSVVQYTYVCALPVVNLAYVCNLSLLYHACDLWTTRVLSPWKTQILCSLQSHSLLSFTVQYQSQHIYTLQQLTHAPQPYNMNVT